MGGITNSMDMSLSKLWETVKDREDWRVALGLQGKQPWGCLFAVCLLSMGLQRDGQLSD